MKINKKLSILIPVMNEEESIHELYQSLLGVLRKVGLLYEIIFVDDGSTDQTVERIISLKKDKNVKLIRFQKNFGKAAALMAGFKVASGDYLITMDGDLQDDPEEIPGLISALEQGSDLVSGWKYKRQDPLDKTIPSKLFNAMMMLFSGVRIHDFNCGLKIYRRELYKKIDVYGSLYRFIPALAGWMGFKVSEIKVQHHKRKYGKSKFGAKRFFIGLYDFFTVVFLNKYLKSPMHLFGSFGLFFTLLGLAIAIYIIYLKITTGTIQGRMPLFVGGFFTMLVGLQMFSIGLLAEIIVKSSRKRDDYLVKDEQELS